MSIFDLKARPQFRKRMSALFDRPNLLNVPDPRGVVLLRCSHLSPSKCIAMYEVPRSMTASDLLDLLAPYGCTSVVLAVM